MGSLRGEKVCISRLNEKNRQKKHLTLTLRNSVY